MWFNRNIINRRHFSFKNYHRSNILHIRELMKKVKYFWFYNMFYLITKIGTNFLQHRGFAETIKDLIFSFNFTTYIIWIYNFFNQWKNVATLKQSNSRISSCAHLYARKYCRYGVKHYTINQHSINILKCQCAKNMNTWHNTSPYEGTGK